MDIKDAIKMSQEMGAIGERLDQRNAEIERLRAELDKRKGSAAIVEAIRGLNECRKKAFYLILGEKTDLVRRDYIRNEMDKIDARIEFLINLYNLELNSRLAAIEFKTGSAKPAPMQNIQIREGRVPDRDRGKR